jgi:hypothetical protein
LQMMSERGSPLLGDSIAVQVAAKGRESKKLERW